MRLNEPAKIIVLDAIHSLAMSENQMTEVIVQNCFKKGGLLKEPITEEMLEYAVQ